MGIANRDSSGEGPLAPGFWEAFEDAARRAGATPAQAPYFTRWARMFHGQHGVPVPEETAGRVDGFLMGLEECGAWDWQVQQARKAVGLFLARAAGAVDRPPRGSGSGTLSPADLG